MGRLPTSLLFRNFVSKLKTISAIDSLTKKCRLEGFFHKYVTFCTILGSQSGDREELRLPEFDAVVIGK
jgi:hypothetical protein